MKPRPGLVVACLVVGLLVMLPQTASSAVPTDVTPNNVYLSPDGDGVADSARIPYRLDKGAGVRIRVYAGSGDVVRQVLRPHQEAGDHAWRWDARDAAGSVVTDGSYRIEIRVTRGSRVRSDYVNAIVDVDGDHGRLLTSRPTVYPMAEAVDDTLLLTYLREGWNPTEDAFPGEDNGFAGRIPLRLRARLVSSRGTVVWQAARRLAGMSSRITWDGRTTAGKAVAAGRYDARVKVTDAAGNATAFVQEVRVSHRQLRAETLTVHLDPSATARTSGVSPPGCNGCGDYCSPVDSSRFPGGLSFATCWSNWSYARFGLPLPFAAAPADTYRVTVTGGPPVAGGAGTGRLDGIDMGPGDATVTTRWKAVDLGHHPYLPEQDLAATWEFSATPEYDLASFTVEYRHYVEAP